MRPKTTGSAARSPTAARRFLVLGLGLPASFGARDPIAKISLPQGSLVLRTISIVDRARHRSRPHTTFSRLLVEIHGPSDIAAVSRLMGTLFGLLGFARNTCFRHYSVARIPKDFPTEQTGVDLSLLLRCREVVLDLFAESTFRVYEAHPNFRALSSDRVRAAVALGEDEASAIVRMLPEMFQNEDLLRALTFYQESVRIHPLWEDYEILEQEFIAWSPDGSANVVDFGPSSGPHQVRLEVSFLCAYRAIEAVVGNPPNDQQRFGCQLRTAGLDPNFVVSSPPYGNIFLQFCIGWLTWVRDKKAAHGSRTGHQDSLQYGELVAAQRCARYILATRLHLGTAREAT